MRTRLTIVIAKLIFWLNRQTGSGGSALPGLIAERLQPDILTALGRKNFPKGVVIITGTNGKTTTAKMTAAILDAAGLKYVHNKAGSNLTRGILSALIAESSLSGKIKADLALLEVDEASLPAVTKALKPSVVVVTNLFRDQLDRYGEVDQTAALLRRALKVFKGELLLNADDPLVTSLGGICENTKYFGVSDYDGDVLEHDQAIDVVKSPTSSEKLHYKKRYFGHIGIYETADGSFARPTPEIEARKVACRGGESSRAAVTIEDQAFDLKLALPGLYNVYNGLAALGLAASLSIDPALAVETLASVDAAFGRVEKIHYASCELTLLLVKNPTGFNQVIATFLKDTTGVPVLFIINDNFADGRDVSWLWDTALEDMADCSGPVYVSGLRAYDMALRLKYAGLTDIKVEEDVKKAITKMVDEMGQAKQAFIVPTYTAMLEARKMLVKETDAKEFWQ